MKQTLQLLIGLIAFSQFAFSQQYLYVSDVGDFQNGPWQILRFKSDGSEGKVFINDNIGWPQDILFLEEEKLVLISNITTANITKFDSETGEYKGVFASNIPGTPTRMKLGPDGSIYVLPWDGVNKVRKYNRTGNYIGDATKTGINGAIGMDWDESGNFYVSSYNGKFVERFSADGTSLGKFITGFAGPTNIEFDNEGNLIVLDFNAGSVKKYNKSGSLSGTIIRNVGECEGLHLFENGNILLGAGAMGAVNLYNSSGLFISQIVPSGALNLIGPNATVIRVITTSNIDQQSKKNQFVYPNTGKLFTFNVSLIDNDIMSIQILNIGGTVVHTLDAGTSKYLTWNAEHLPDACYLVQAKSKSGKLYSQKIIKTN